MKIDPKGASPKDIYKLMIRVIVPRPIAWISTVSSDGVLNVAPYSFFAGITPSPPTVCFASALKPDGQKKDTLSNIEATGEFVINIVTEELAEKMNETATDFPADYNEFDQAALTALASDIVSPPRIAESPVHMECTLHSAIPVGNIGAVLVVGEVVAFHVDDRVITDGNVDPGLLKAVGRMGGMEYTRTSDRFVLERRKFKGEAR